MDRSAILPPVGLIGPDDHGTVTTHLSNLAREASEVAGDWITRAERNLDIFTFGASPEPAASMVTSNQIQDAVNGVVDFQTKDPAVRTLDPVERGEPGEVYYFTPASSMMPAQVQGPFTPDEAAAMQQQQVVTGMDEMLQPITAPVYNPANFVTIDDQTTAEFFQKQMDTYWRRGQLDRAIRDVVHSGNVFGFLFPVYEWDKDRHRPRLWTDISLRDTYVDPTREKIEDAAYAGVDWWIPAEQAIAMFPHLADIITERARTGMPERPSSETSLGFTVNKVGNFRRNTIVLRVFWLRNQPCPYEADEALAAGLLERQMIPLGDPGATIEDAEQKFPKGADNEPVGDAQRGEVRGAAPEQPAGMGDDESGTVQPSEAAAGAAPAVDGGGAIAQAGAAGGLPTRAAHFLPGTNTEVTPPTRGDATTLDPNWPMYQCTRQITAVLGLVVDDRESEYYDGIPMLQMISTRIPYQPFGQGLPERLESLQDGHTQMLTNIRDHTDLHAHPMTAFSNSVWEQLPPRVKERGASLAGLKFNLPDAMLVDDRGNPRPPGMMIPPPPMSQALIDGEKIFNDKLSERSGNPDVLNGRPPAGVTGWQSIQLLSQNASSRFGFSQQWTRDVITRLVHFVLHDIIDPRKVTIRDLMAVDSRYPEQIVSAFQQRGAMIEWDVNVEVQTGVGSSRNKKQAEAIEALKTTDPITGEPAMSMESVRDTMGIDNQQEQQRIQKAREIAMQAQAQQMQMQAAMNPQPAPGEGKGGGKKPPSNGNGQHSGNGNGRMNFGGQ